MEYGILAETWLESKTMFIRHWVCLPDDIIRTFDDETVAQKFAHAMNCYAKENGIVSTSYRAKQIKG